MQNLLDSCKLRKYQVNPEGGMIYVDHKVEKWLDSFKNGNFSGKTDQEIDIYKRITKSGIEDDQDPVPPKSLPTISLVLVTYNSEFWMDNINKMFSSLGEWLFEIIVVDNGSVDNCLEKLVPNEKISIIKNDLPLAFAAAVNQGCRLATGDLFLLINPDVVITKNALSSLIDFYLEHSDAAAIVPKLLLMRTPGFINGVGNIVPLFRWGYDLGLGHLDVGQFDDMFELPSACFATVLIPKEKWISVGELDEGYPMYYEDSDWSYRAREMGLKIFVDTKCLVYHAFRANQSRNEDMSSTRLFNISYGRLRFLSKNIHGIQRLCFLTSYIIFDLIFAIYSLFKWKFNFDYLISLARGWKNFFAIKKFPTTNRNPSHKIYPLAYRHFLPINREGIPKIIWHHLIKYNIL